MKRKVLFVTVLSVLFCGCNSYDYSGDDIIGAKAVIRGTISEATRTVGTTWIESDCIGVTCDNDVNIPYKYIESSLSFMASDEEQSIYLRPQQRPECR